MGINTGAFLGPIVCGYLAESPSWGWHYGFAAAGVGMVLGLITYVWGREQYLPGIGLLESHHGDDPLRTRGFPCRTRCTGSAAPPLVACSASWAAGILGSRWAA